MKIEKIQQCYEVTTNSIIVKIDCINFDIIVSIGSKIAYCGKVDVRLDSLEQCEFISDMELDSISEQQDIIKLSFIQKSNLWTEKKIVIEIREESISCYGMVKGNELAITDVTYYGNNQKKTDFKKYIVPRFDWSHGKVLKSAEENDILSCQQWLSPPPFCYILTDEVHYVPAFVCAEKGQNNYVSMKYQGESASFSLQFEGHQIVKESYQTPRLVLGKPQNNYEMALRYYKDFLVKERSIITLPEKEIPKWWKEPIFCGWGEMRYEYRTEHDSHENGNFINVTDYCTQKRYENYISVLEKNGIDPGIIIIDMGWANEAALSAPNPHKWEDMRGFIDKEHKKGKHVLLWFTPVVTQGLPNEACMMLHNRAVAPDPTNPIYQKILKQEIYKMLSEDEGCLNADGFKIDFTQNTPSEEGIFRCYLNSFWGLINETNEKHLYSHRKERKELVSVYKENVWGMELLKEYIFNIYVNMKKIKGDSLLITHTPNPYFAEVVDMLRLNDLDGESEGVLEIMKGRALLANIGCDKWLIDTDNDLMVDKKHWRDYLEMQLELGIPDTYYATHIAASGEKFDEKEYLLLKNVFKRHREKIS
ncbi:MAG: hypothetical protein RR139_05940 [Lachnospiraceae bacterium]